MEKYLKILLMVFVCSTVTLLGMFVGYNIFNPAIVAEKPMIQNNVEAATVSVTTPSPSPTPTQTPAVIKPTTKMVYEYYYPLDQTVETSEENAPYFLLNISEEKLVDIFSDWAIESFSEEKVVMRKTMDGPSVQHYVVGIQDGFVSVFYQQPVNGTVLKEITDTPISALSTDEQSRLEQGVLVSGEEELLRVLEDYSS